MSSFLLGQSDSKEPVGKHESGLYAGRSFTLKVGR